jgi:putative lysine transport system permease protein
MPSGFFPGVWYLLQTKWSVFLTGVLTTLLISLLGTLFGFMLGSLLATFRLLPRDNRDSKIYRIFITGIDWLTRCYIQVFRGTPMIVQATVIYYGVLALVGYWSAMVAGIVVVSLNTAAYMAEIIRGGVNAVDKGQNEAAEAIGMSYFQSMRYIIFPQAFKNAIPAFGNELIVNIKDTAVLSVIAVSDLFYSSKFIITTNFRPFEVYFIICIIYLILTMTSSFILRKIEKQLKVNSHVNIPTSQTTLEVIGTGHER